MSIKTEPGIKVSPNSDSVSLEMSSWQKDAKSRRLEVIKRSYDAKETFVLLKFDDGSYIRFLKSILIESSRVFKITQDGDPSKEDMISISVVKDKFLDFLNAISGLNCDYDDLEKTINTFNLAVIYQVRFLKDEIIVHLERHFSSYYLTIKKLELFLTFCKTSGLPERFLDQIDLSKSDISRNNYQDYLRVIVLHKAFPLLNQVADFLLESDADCDYWPNVVAPILARKLKRKLDQCKECSKKKQKLS